MENLAKNSCFIYVIIIVITGNLCKKLSYGSPCTTDEECRDGKVERLVSGNRVNIFIDDEYSMCDRENARCNCSNPLSREYKNNNYVCARAVHVHFGNAPTCKLDDPETCVNGVCTKDILRGAQCICNDGFLYIGNRCREVVTVAYSEACKTPELGPVPLCNYDKLMRCNIYHNCECYSGHIYDKKFSTCITKDAYIEKYQEESIAGLNEFCGTTSDGLPKVCDETKSMTCQTRKCRCTKDFYPLEESKSCESKEVFVKKHNISSYKVIHGVYCFNDYDCITGLICYHNKCACKYPCIYNSAAASCDCKAEEQPFWKNQKGRPFWEDRRFPVLVVVVIGVVALLVLCAKAYYSKRSLTEMRLHSRQKKVYAPDEYKPAAEPYRILYKFKPAPPTDRPRNWLDENYATQCSRPNPENHESDSDQTATLSDTIQPEPPKMSANSNAASRAKFIQEAKDYYKCPEAEEMYATYCGRPNPENHASDSDQTATLSDTIQPEPYTSPNPASQIPIPSLQEALDYYKGRDSATANASDLMSAFLPNTATDSGERDSMDPTSAQYSAVSPYDPSAPSGYSAPTANSTTAQIENSSYDDIDINSSNTPEFDIYKPIIF